MGADPSRGPGPCPGQPASVRPAPAPLSLRQAPLTAGWQQYPDHQVGRGGVDANTWHTRAPGPHMGPADASDFTPNQTVKDKITNNFRTPAANPSAGYLLRTVSCPAVPVLGCAPRGPHPPLLQATGRLRPTPPPCCGDRPAPPGPRGGGSARGWAVASSPGGRLVLRVLTEVSRSPPNILLVFWFDGGESEDPSLNSLENTL